MEKKHNSDAYYLVILTRYLAEKALDLYHAASRNESTAYDENRFQEELQAVAQAFDTFQENKGL